MEVIAASKPGMETLQKSDRIEFKCFVLSFLSSHIFVLETNIIRELSKYMSKYYLQKCIQIAKSKRV